MQQTQHSADAPVVPMRWRSTLSFGEAFPEFPQAVVREERSQARVPCEQGVLGGPIHRLFVESLPAEWQADRDVEIFSRLAWVKPGWLPLSQFYHCDWSLPEGLDRCPSLDLAHRVQTRMVMVGGFTHTLFVDDTVSLDPPPPGGGIPRGWAAQVAQGVESGALKTVRMPEHRWVHFDNFTWHQAMPATGTGWRLLLRAIRGLSAAQRYHNRGRFHAIRNSYHPETPEARAAYAPYV